MATIFDFRARRMRPSPQEDGNWNELRQSLRDQFPNPQRIGCPDVSLLNQLARRNMRLDEAGIWLDHFSRCSSCFRDFEKLQSQAARRRKAFWLSTAAAVIALCSGSLLYRHHQANAKGSTSAHVQPAQRWEISLHYEDVVFGRDAVDEPETNLQKLPRRSLSLSVYLPAGSEGGNYSVAVLPKLDGPPLVSCGGKAEVEGALTVLRATPDTSNLPPGVYLLAVRPTGGRWRYFRVAIA